MHESNGIDAYVTREAHARRFAESEGRLQSLFDVAAGALVLCAPEARKHWLARIEELSSSDIEGVLGGVPEMSAAVRTFCREVVLRAREELFSAVSR